MPGVPECTWPTSVCCGWCLPCDSSGLCNIESLMDFPQTKYGSCSLGPLTFALVLPQRPRVHVHDLQRARDREEESAREWRRGRGWTGRCLRTKSRQQGDCYEDPTGTNRDSRKKLLVTSRMFVHFCSKAYKAQGPSRPKHQ